MGSAGKSPASVLMGGGSRRAKSATRPNDPQVGGAARREQWLSGRVLAPKRSWHVRRRGGTARPRSPRRWARGFFVGGRQRGQLRRDRTGAADLSPVSRPVYSTTWSIAACSRRYSRRPGSAKSIFPRRAGHRRDSGSKRLGTDGSSRARDRPLDRERHIAVRHLAEPRGAQRAAGSEHPLAQQVADGRRQAGPGEHELQLFAEGVLHHRAQLHQLIEQASVKLVNGDHQSRLPLASALHRLTICERMPGTSSCRSFVS